MQSKYTSCALSQVINFNIDLTHLDNNDYDPLMTSLRQQSSEFARILMNSKTKLPVDLNKPSLKHGYPLHIAILSHKFDIAFEMLSKKEIDPQVLNTIGANSLHLLFLKYEKDTMIGFEILKKMVKMGVDVNLVD